MSLLAIAIGSPAAARAQAPASLPHSSPFTATLSNTTPLVTGMSVDDATQALGTPLSYVNGRPGDEVFLAYRNARGSGLFVNKDRL
jgi:hypothetical protein